MWSSTLAELRTPGTPGAGMGAGSDNVEVVEGLGAIVEAEPGGLGKDRRDGETAAQFAQVVTFEILRGHEEIGTDGCFQAGKDCAVEGGHDAVTELRSLGFPVDGCFQVRDGGEDVEESHPSGANDGSVAVGRCR